MNDLSRVIARHALRADDTEDFSGLQGHPPIRIFADLEAALAHNVIRHSTKIL
jgi:hypothetical protein